MSKSAFLFVFLSFLFPITIQQTLPPIALNPERIKLLKDALSWMTFRKNGELASEQDLKPFFRVLKDQYVNSKHYKTLIIAFTRGVLPKLTLKENIPCDPAYTLEYKDSYNNSVTYGLLKEFIWNSYDKRGDTSRQFCDYREGLVCNHQTKKCECPEGSQMELISQGSTDKRCLLQENQVCTLIDLDHDPRSNYGALKKHLPEMILNLEKPLSCKIGTQCRFKNTARTTPLCYKVNDGPWDKGAWGSLIGEKCTLGLYGDTGPCIKRSDVFWEVLGKFNGYTCFNFGARSQPKSPSPYVGYCAHEMGPYAMSSIDTGAWNTDEGRNWDLQMIGFVSPATTPLRGSYLSDYYNDYLTNVESYLDSSKLFTAIAPNAGDRCNVEKTEKLAKLWEFFKSLEDPPPPGKYYSANYAELKEKLNEAKALTYNLNQKSCRVCTYMFSDSIINHALKCVPASFTDEYGNDGKCQVIPESEDVTYSWAESFFKYRKHVAKIHSTTASEETKYRRDIYEPDLECDRNLGPPPGSEGAPPSTDTHVLEGGYCPPDRGCYEDYDDRLDIYDKDCNLKEPKPKIFLNCQDLGDSVGYRLCEWKYLDKLFKEELETLPSYPALERGHACNHDFEEKFRYWVKTDVDSLEWNKHRRLIEIYNFKNGIGGTVSRICDWKKLLKCSQSGTCECLMGTNPREVVMEGGETIFSDYCYFTSGKCSPRTKGDIYRKSTQYEKTEINRHYNARKGEGGSSCRASNWCVFVLAEEEEEDPNEPPSKAQEVCTEMNTGTTGHNGEDPTTTTSTTTVRTTSTSTKRTTTTTRRTTTTRIRTTTGRDDSNLMCVGKKCGWQEAGEAQNEIHVMLKIMVVIKMLTTCV